MRFVNVVPVRRMQADRPWLTYDLPETLTVQPGSLVTIPLRGRPILGVVWETHDQAPKYHTQNISAVHLTEPILTAWQRRVCQVMAEAGSTSLGDVVFRVIPKLTLRGLAKALSGSIRPVPIPPVPTESFLWYRDRTEAMQKISTVITEQAEQPIVIVTPTNDDAEELVRLVEGLGKTAFHLHGQVAPTIYASWYDRIRNGESLIVIGGLSALAIPCHHPPLIILDQEEHHAHKQTAQFPYYDTRAVLQQLAVPMQVTTPAPGVTLYHRQHPLPPAPSTNRTLISLHGPKQGPLLSEETLTIIDDVIAKKQRLAVIAPRRGYASSTACRVCGTVVVCPTCGRSASIFRGLADEARCHACQTSIPSATSCQKCGATDWAFHGYGSEQTVSALQRLRPDLTITPVIKPEVTADIGVDTYQAYRSLRRIINLGAVIVISGDSLLSSPDYSVAERAWQYLARLQAEVPRLPLAVQTFEPHSPFWQRWVAGDDRAWYDDELQQRQRLRVPPFSLQWIAAYRGQQKVVTEKMTELEKKYGQGVTVRVLPQRATPPNKHRLLINFNNQELFKTLPWITIFALPWHLDRYPTSWLD